MDEPPTTTLVTLTLDAADDRAAARLMPALARYVVLTRAAPGCRNVDLCASATVDHRFVIVEKWDQPEQASDHLESDETLALATACQGLLARAPAIDLLDGLNAHDLR